jgi:hypothetical protein
MSQPAASFVTQKVASIIIHAQQQESQYKAMLEFQQKSRDLMAATIKDKSEEIDRLRDRIQELETHIRIMHKIDDWIPMSVFTDHSLCPNEEDLESYVGMLLAE